MRSFSLTVLLFAIINQSIVLGQSGQVVDNVNLLSLSGVLISDTDSSIAILTESDGKFKPPKEGTYFFVKEGYVTQSVFLSIESNATIELVASPEYLNEVIITSNNFKSKLNTLPTAISIISTENIQTGNSVNIAPMLNSIPGVYVHNGTLTANRITIRGIGSRNLFGTSRIRAYYQDIPLTNGSGTSTIENLEISSLGRIEIVKGSSSSTYGASLGGTIHLIPKKAEFGEVSVKSGFTFGSFGLRKYLLEASLGKLNHSGSIIYSNTHSDGYRQNNETDRQTLTVVTNHLIGEDDKLTFVGNYIDLKAFIPSSINEDDYLASPTSSAFTWGQAKGFEDYKKGLFGLSWQHDYNSRVVQYTSVFSSFLDSYEPRPFNILEENTNGIGIRSRIVSKTTFLGKSFEWTLGGELFRDINSYQTHQNLYQTNPTMKGSIQGDLLSDFIEKRMYLNMFVDTKYHFAKNTTLSVGLNSNKLSYNLEDGSDLSGNYDFGIIFSPKIGMTYQMSKNTMLYSAISHGFSPPSLEETLLPDGLINTDIKPESGWNYELGSRGNTLDNKLQYTTSIYRMDVKNLLVARRTANDEFVGVNAGKTRYVGLEATLNYSILKNRKFNIANRNAFALNYFKFREFIDDTDDHSGNDLTGVPKLTFTSNLSIESIYGMYAILSYNYVGETPIRDDNSVYSDEYQIINARLGYKSLETKKVQFNAFISVNNILNEKYASMLLINAGSFGGNKPRYYYPGEPINYYAGVSLKYIL